jgi:hypothetical protein
MSMRKKIAHVVWQNENCVGFSVARVLWARTFEAFSKDGCEPITAYRTADAILAALPDMIAPLVWVRSDVGGWNDDYHTLPTKYKIRLADENGWKLSFDGGFRYCRNADEAKAAANTHHRAAIMAAFTGETQ